MNEKAYKTMSRSGAGALTVGIIMMVAGLVCGIIAVVSGARLLHDKKEIMDSVRRISAAFELLPVFCGNHGKNQSDQNLSLQSGSIFGNQAFYHLSEEAGNDSSSSKSARKCCGVSSVWLFSAIP